MVQLASMVNVLLCNHRWTPYLGRPPGCLSRAHLHRQISKVIADPSRHMLDSCTPTGSVMQALLCGDCRCFAVGSAYCAAYCILHATCEVRNNDVTDTIIGPALILHATCALEDNHITGTTWPCTVYKPSFSNMHKACYSYL